MHKYQPIREVIRELNTTYFHDKRMALDVSLFISGPSGKNINLVIDRVGGIRIIKQFSEMHDVETPFLFRINGEEPGKSIYYLYYSLQYTDEYSVQTDDACEIEIWREIERAEQ